MSLIVTGTVGIDTVHTPTSKAERVLGGSAAYFAAAASFYGDVRLVAAAGDDWPEAHRELLGHFERIRTDGLEIREGSQTFAWGGRYMENMNERETLFTELGVLEEAGPPIPESFRDSRFVFLANTHPSEQMRLLEAFPERTLAVADTMDLWINIAHPELLALLRRLDGVVMNDEEAILLTEEANSVSAGHRILDLGPTFVIIKKGEHGCLLIHREGIAVLPAYPVEAGRVVDPTGAGDTFAGGMMGHLALSEQTSFAAIQTAMAWGTVTASFTLESFSLDRLARLSWPELEQRLDLFRAMAKVG